MGNIIPFSFENKITVRIIVLNNHPWFVAADVCEILNLTNTTKAISNLDDDEKGLTNSYTLGGNQDLSIISESGLYALILRSRKPEAKKFRKWVTSEVLPAIRKTGAYIHAPAMHPAITPEQLRTLKNEISDVKRGWFLGDGAKQWILNHLRVAFQVARVEDIPRDCFEAAIALVRSKDKSITQLYQFVWELRDWFERECLGSGTPWTPAIKRKLSAQLKRQVILPPKVDWLALADEASKKARDKKIVDIDPTL